jgi:repressor of nif and glnA expression
MVMTVGSRLGRGSCQNSRVNRASCQNRSERDDKSVRYRNKYIDKKKLAKKVSQCERNEVKQTIKRKEEEEKSYWKT